MATKQNLQIIQGDSKSYNLTFRNTAGVALDISTWTIYFTVKRAFSDADADAILLKTVAPGQHTDPTHGITVVALDTTDTGTLSRGNYYYSIQAQTGVNNLYTLLKGNYTVEEVADRNS